MDYQQANVIQQMVFAAIDNIAENGVTETEAAVTPKLSIPETTQVLTPTQAPVADIHAANAAVMATNQQLMQQMQEMMRVMQSMQVNQQGGTIQTTGNNANSGRRQPKPWKYCHTHGYCKHAGSECTSKGQNHKDEATLYDNMGGNKRGFERWQRSLNHT